MASKPERPERVPDLKPGNYTDGHPLDTVQYLECKIILKPERFVSAKSFWDFAKAMRPATKEYDVGYSTEGMEDTKPQIREVLFVDTKDFRFYNNAFILRRRIPYEDGFPVGTPKSSSSSAIPTCRRLQRWTSARTCSATSKSNSKPRHFR